mmetsp:Transcript_9894/g.24066  ORF Transcript_9894/g.24066 Transcript_9894/m.24066 type:complete len:201 (-) Transcript_9894:118-720(-)
MGFNIVRSCFWVIVAGWAAFLVFHIYLLSQSAHDWTRSHIQMLTPHLAGTRSRRGRLKGKGTVLELFPGEQVLHVGPQAKAKAMFNRAGSDDEEWAKEVDEQMEEEEEDTAGDDDDFVDDDSEWDDPEGFADSESVSGQDGPKDDRSASGSGGDESAEGKGQQGEAETNESQGNGSDGRASHQGDLMSSMRKRAEQAAPN